MLNSWGDLSHSNNRRGRKKAGEVVQPQQLEQKRRENGSPFRIYQRTNVTEVTSKKAGILIQQRYLLPRKARKCGTFGAPGHK